MPRPRYILCAERRLTDAYSGLITHVNVIELLALADPGERKEVSHDLRGAPAMQWMVTSVWMRDDTDEDQQFESQLLMYLPGVDSPKTLVENDVVFKTVFYRMEALILGPMVQQ